MILRQLAALVLGFAVTAAGADDDAARIAQIAATCAECHGPQGVSSTPGVPSLAGQNAPYLLEELEEMRSTLRPSEVMGPVVAALAAEDLPRLADHFAALPYVRQPQPVDPAKAARGREAYLRLCQLCHPADGRAATYAEYPLLAGQDLGYMQQTMAEILAGRRKANGLMVEMVSLATAERLDEAMHYFAAQQVKPDEVSSARLGTPGARKRRFKPAYTN